MATLEQEINRFKREYSSKDFADLDLHPEFYSDLHQLLVDLGYRNISPLTYRDNYHQHYTK